VDWVLQAFTFSYKHTSGKEIVVTDALSRTYTFLLVLEAKVLNFQSIKTLYIKDKDFKKVIKKKTLFITLSLYKGVPILRETSFASPKVP